MNITEVRNVIKLAIAEAMEKGGLPKSGGKLVHLKKELASLKNMKESLGQLQIAEGGEQQFVAEYAHMQKFVNELEKIKTAHAKLSEMLDNQITEVDDTCFVSGMYNPPHPCYRPLWGTLYVTRKNYQKIGGYNENMGEFVAWEDDEIVNRLLLCGLKHKKIRHTHQTAFTLSHDNKKRIENFEAYHTNQQIKEDLESLLVKKSRDVDSYIDYAILSHHTVLNMKKYKRYKGDDFYVDPVVKWNVEQVDNQNYIARKITQ